MVLNKTVPLFCGLVKRYATCIAFTYPMNNTANPIEVVFCNGNVHLCKLVSMGRDIATITYWDYDYQCHITKEFGTNDILSVSYTKK